MRRWLLGSTALAVAAGIAGPAATADRIRLSLGGYFSTFGVAGEQDDGPGEPGFGLRQHGLARESEVHFVGETTLDNGLAVGVDVQLQGETVADQIDESYIYFDGRLGRLQLGSEDPATDEMIYGAPTPIDQHGVNSPTFFHAASGANAVGTSATYVNLSFDSDKVTYFTPRLAGFQFGVSYTPDNTEELGAAFRPDTTAGQQSEVWEAAANWTGAFRGVEIAVYGGFATAELEGGGPGLEDQEQWGVGAALSYAGFTLGSGYREDDLGISSANSDRYDFNIGLVYAWGAWQVGAAYARAEVEVGPAAGKDSLDQYEVGAIYALGPGILLSGGLQLYRYESDTGGPPAENDAVVGVLGTSFYF